MITTYTIGEMAKKLHKSVRTLQQWDRDKKLISYRTPSGRRYYTEDQLLAYFGESKKEKQPKRVIAYCRVSSKAQCPELKNQRKALENYCVASGISNVEFIQEIAGGLNFKREKFRKIMAAIQAREVKTLIIAHKDRLARFGFEYLKWECEQYGCSLEVLNNQQLSPEQEMVHDLLAIVHCFSSRLYGLRKYKKSIKAELKHDS